MKLVIYILALVLPFTDISDEVLPIVDGECRWYLYHNGRKSEILTDTGIPIPIFDTGDYTCVVSPTREFPLMLGRAIICVAPERKKFVEGAACGRRDSMRSRSITVGAAKLAIACERK